MENIIRHLLDQNKKNKKHISQIRKQLDGIENKMYYPILLDIMNQCKPLIKCKVDWIEGTLEVNNICEIKHNGYILMFEATAESYIVSYNPSTYMQPDNSFFELESITIDNVYLYDSEGDEVYLTEGEKEKIEQWANSNLEYE